MESSKANQVPAILWCSQWHARNQTTQRIAKTGVWPTFAEYEYEASLMVALKSE